MRYRIQDNFQNFWFRFIYRNMSAVETGNFNYIKEIVRRDYSAYSGILLEKMVRQLLASSQKYNKIGTWWDRKSENEIDIVAVNELKKHILFADVKLNKDKINLDKLQKQSQAVLQSYPGYKAEYKGFCLNSIQDFLA